MEERSRSARFLGCSLKISLILQSAMGASHSGHSLPISSVYQVYDYSYYKSIFGLSRLLVLQGVNLNKEIKMLLNSINLIVGVLIEATIKQ